MSLQTLHTPESGPVLYSLDGDPRSKSLGSTNPAVGSLLVDTGENDLYEKTGAGAAAWTKLGTVAKKQSVGGGIYMPFLRRYSVAP